MENKYNPINAYIYAAKYWQTYNTNYPNWHEYGGDCTNFISQCLFAGGMLKTGPTEQPSNNLNYWYSYGNKTDINKVSSSWRGANAFKYYWTNNSKESKYFTNYNINAYIYGKIGDFVSLINPKTNTAYHTMIIIGYSTTNGEKDLICAQHSPNLFNASLLNKKTNFIIFKVTS